MRGLAKYAMLGQRQAVISVLLCGFFPFLYFISAAIVGLVNLRKSSSEGLMILLWSMLPAGFSLAMGDSTSMVLMLSVAALSQLLKRQYSWQTVILISCLLGVLVQFSLRWQTLYVEQVEYVIAETVTLQQSQGAEVPYTAEQLVELLLSFYGAYHVTVIILCLMLARWWQAALYNPGGFQQELHQLRLDPRAAVLLSGLIIAAMMGVKPLDSWLTILCIAPTFSGMALVHYGIAKKKAGGSGLVIAYFVLFFAAPIVVLLGLIDGLTDLRKRMDNQDQQN